MSKAPVFTLILVFCMMLSGCSVYRSAGRKGFESKVSSNQSASSAETRTSTGTENFSPETMTEPDCWNQPLGDPLWHLSPTSSMTVTQINEDEIQVCAIQL